mgnify:CR=1 FL=1
MSKNDDKILELKKQIEAKKASLGPIKRFAPLTSCSLELNGTRYNLHATDRPTLILSASLHLTWVMRMNVLSPVSLLKNGAQTSRPNWRLWIRSKILKS